MRVNAVRDCNCDLRAGIAEAGRPHTAHHPQPQMLTLAAKPIRFVAVLLPKVFPQMVRALAPHRRQHRPRPLHRAEVSLQLAPELLATHCDPDHRRTLRFIAPLIAPFTTAAPSAPSSAFA